MLKHLLALAACALYGLGYGFATPGTNLWVGETYGERRASALNIANLAWGLGAERMTEEGFLRIAVRVLARRDVAWTEGRRESLRRTYRRSARP